MWNRFWWGHVLAGVCFVLAACTATDTGTCDEVAAATIYYDTNGFPAYPGQALVETSCGNGAFCHSQGIDPSQRYGAPAGIDLDVGVATDPGDLARLRFARRVAWNLRDDVYGQVLSGKMPPGSPAVDEIRASTPGYHTLDALPLPDIASPEGHEILRNWIACGVPVIEGIDGTSQGVGDIVPRGDVTSGGGCSTGQAYCADMCIDVSSDAMNCGGCGAVCGPTQQCAGAACTCVGGLTACGSSCVSTATDPNNCGSCGNTCGTAQGCAASACTCAGGLTACGADCVDTATDVGNCGGCGMACAGTAVCFGSACSTMGCPTGTTDCGGSCVDETISNANCGGCGVVCPAGQACASGHCACTAGLTICAGACADTATDAANCGSCGQACGAGQVCSGSACVCPAGTTSCGGTCVVTATDPANCGSCGHACSAGQACSGGACACAAGTTDCGGTCVNTSSDPANCGSCGMACTGGASCSAGTCMTCGSATLSGNVQPIFTASCTASGCHTGVRAAAGMSLDAGRSWASTVNVHANCGTEMIVAPGSPSSSYIINKLTNVGICNGGPMPKVGVSLTASQIDTIRSWICRGAPND